MPPIYFHGNGNWYKKHNLTVSQGKFLATKCCFFSTVTTASYAFAPAMKQWTKACMPHLKKSVPVEVTPCHHCWTASPSASLCSPPLFGLHTCSARVHEWHGGCHFFSAWRNLMSHLSFIHTSTLDAILSDWPATITYTATKCNGEYVGRFSLYYHTISIWHCGPK